MLVGIVILVNKVYGSNFISFLKKGHPKSSFSIFSFQTIETIFSETRTHIVRVEGQQTDHLTTTTACKFYR